MFKWHKHEWEKVSDDIVPAFSEKYNALSMLHGMQTWVYERKQVTRLRCNCGKTKKVVVAVHN